MVLSCASTLEVSQFVWQCPGCRVYQIDLLDVDEDELEKIPAPYAQILRTRNWQKITDSEVLTRSGTLSAITTRNT